jgi:heme oxygenase
MNVSTFQQKIKEQTAEAHKKAEQHPLMQSFINGTYTKEHLLHFLINLHPLYTVVEERFLKDKINLYPDLKRTNLIEQDINVLIPEIVDFKKLNLLIPTKEVKTWVDNSQNKPVSLLKAEFYTRWLADFYGGRVLSNTIKPNSMYLSKEEPFSVITTIREIVDESNECKEVTEEDIIQETLKVFDLHLLFFDFIYYGTTSVN